MDGKTGIWCSFNSVSQRRGGVGELQLISTRKQSFPLKGKAVLPVTGRGSPPALQSPLSKLAIPTQEGALQSQSQAGVIVLVLPLKPVTSPTPSSSQQSPKVQPVPGLEGGGGAGRGCGSAMGGGGRRGKRPFLLSTGTAGGCLQRGAGQGQE